MAEQTQMEQALAALDAAQATLDGILEASTRSLMDSGFRFHEGTDPRRAAMRDKIVAEKATGETPPP